MALFFSLEALGKSGDAIWALLRPIEHALKAIDVADYTNDIDKIAIVVNCFDDKFLNEGFGQPRKFISYKKRFADIRLNIPFDQFLKADKHKRFEMIKKNIYDSIEVVNERLNKKKGSSFEGERLIADIEEKLKDLKF